MSSSSMQIPSINAFTCQHFSELFSEGNPNGTITTKNNGRTYQITWDKSTDAIVVKRDLANVDIWTRITEIIERFSSLEVTSNASKWQCRLNVQKHNLRLAAPLKTKTQWLLMEIEDVDTYLEPMHFPGRTVQDHLRQVCMPLTQLLEEKKQRLFERAEQLSLLVNEELISDQYWTNERKARGAVNHLQEQLRQLNLFIVNIRKITLPYCAAMGSIDVSRTDLIYSAVSTRLSAVAIKMRLMIDNYFEAAGNIPKIELQSYNDMIKSEAEFVAALNNQQLSTHFTYNELLFPPQYENANGKDAQNQALTEFNYRTHVIAFTNVLVDPAKKLSDIQNGSEELLLVRKRWQVQINLEEKLSKLICQIHEQRDDLLISYPIFITHFEALQTMQKQVHHNGELLGPESFELLHSQYTNLVRANALYLEIAQFLANLPGFVELWKISNYNDEMQSRILHLTVLRNMCQEEESLENHALDHMEHFVATHKNQIQLWVGGKVFSHFKFYDPISKNLPYPVWLVKEHRLFQQKTRKVSKNLWEEKYQALRNVELLKARNQLLEKVVAKTKKLKHTSKDFSKVGKKLHSKYTWKARMCRFFGFSSDERPVHNPGEPDKAVTSAQS